MRRNSATHATAASFCVLGLAGAACGQDLPEIRYETEHLRIGTTFDEPLCQGDLDHFERVITTLEGLLVTSVEQPVDVYLWDLTESSTSPGWCANPGVGGCFSDGVVYADQASIDHELVHAVIATFAKPPRFWSEGAATGLQSDPTEFGWSPPLDNLDLRAPQLDYKTAGHFSRWLLEREGIELYRALLRAPGSAREAFERTYDVTMEEAQAQYYAEAPHSYGALLTCDHADLPETGDLHWSETIEIDCANPDVRSIPLGMGAYRVLTITEGGYYDLSTSADAGVISRCRDEDLEVGVAFDEPGYGDLPPVTGGAAWLFAGDGGVPLLELVPGRYKVAVGHEGHEARTVEVDVRAAEGPIPQVPEAAG